MPFFIKNANKSPPKTTHKRKLNSRKKKLTEEIISSDEEEHKNPSDKSSSEDENETVQEKRLRLAKIYLQETKKAEEKKLESEELQDAVQKRLKEDYFKQTGKLKLSIADNYKGFDFENTVTLKCKEHQKAVTTLCISSDNKFIYTGSKDGNLVKWSLSSKDKISSLKNEKNKTIFSIAVSSDLKCLCVGDETYNIQIYDPESLQHLKTLQGHRNAVTGLVFKKNSHVLYSSSKDHCVKVWNLDEMSYIETLYGHSDAITSIDTLIKDRVVTSGGADSTIRLWKTVEETQLIFNGSGSIDCVKFMNDETFVSGNDRGELSVWMLNKKKPLCVKKDAHGLNINTKQPNWITSVASLVNTDLIASGSSNGFVRLWKLSDNYEGLKNMFEIPVEGFVNSLSFSNDGNFLIVAVGREHRFGRWEVIKSLKNSVIIIPLQKCNSK